MTSFMDQLVIIVFLWLIPRRLLAEMWIASISNSHTAYLDCGSVRARDPHWIRCQFPEIGSSCRRPNPRPVLLASVSSLVDLVESISTLSRKILNEQKLVIYGYQKHWSLSFFNFRERLMDIIYVRTHNFFFFDNDIQTVFGWKVCLCNMYTSNFQKYPILFICLEKKKLLH